MSIDEEQRQLELERIEEILKVRDGLYMVIGAITNVHETGGINDAQYDFIYDLVENAAEYIARTI